MSDRERKDMEGKALRRWEGARVTQGRPGPKLSLHVFRTEGSPGKGGTNTQQQAQEEICSGDSGQMPGPPILPSDKVGSAVSFGVLLRETRRASSPSQTQAWCCGCSECPQRSHGKVRSLRPTFQEEI